MVKEDWRPPSNLGWPYRLGEIEPRVTFRDTLLGIVPPLLWAATYAFAKPGLDHFPPLFFTGLVYGLAALLLWRPRQRPRTPLVIIVIVAALAGAVQSGLVFAGLSGLPASLAAVVVQLQVPFAVLAAVMLCGERLNLQRAGGILIAFAGIALASGVVGTGTRAIPLLLMIAGTASWGLAQAIIRRFVRDDGQTLIACITRFATPMLLISSALLEQGQLESVATARVVHWSSIAVMAVGGFVVAYPVWYKLLGRYRVDQVTPFALLMPPFGIAAGWLILDEDIGLREIAGALIVIAGLWCVIKVPERLNVPARNPEQT